MTEAGRDHGAEPKPDGAGDPSMEDILASIRRILSEDEQATAEPPAKADDVLVLDSAMIVGDPPPVAAAKPATEQPPARAPEPRITETRIAEPRIAEARPPDGAAPAARAVAPERAALVAPEAAAAATAAVGGLLRTLAAGRATATHRGGPTIEDIVREEMRPLLKQWLDSNLPALVERLVTAEIERVVSRDLS